MKRKYFISYSHKNGFGQCDVTINAQINSMYEIIKDIIKSKTKAEGIIILNYKRIWWWSRWL